MIKPVRWVGSSREDLKEFPKDVRSRVGGAGVLEIVDDFDGDTYRAVYTVRFAGAVYVLHAFQKKSKRGIAAPKPVLHVIQSRLRRAQEDYELWLSSGKHESR